MPINRRWIAIVVAIGLLGAQGGQPRGSEDEPKTPAASLHDSFETPQIAWEREHTDTTINLIAQDRSVRTAHDGNLSEHFQFEADTGSQFFVSYALPNVPVTDKLQAVVYVRANRTEFSFLDAWSCPPISTPRPATPSYVMIQGTAYEGVDRWQRLELTDMLPSIERQARVLRASSRRPVSLKGAYLERLVVNLMGSPGPSEVFLDDLSVAPVPGDLLASWTAPQARKSSPNKPAGGSRPGAGKAAVDPMIRLDRNRLRRLGDDRRYHEWLPTAINAPGADITELRRHGFDLLVDDRKGDVERIKTAIDKGFLLMPRLSSIASQTDPKKLLDEVDKYPYKDFVAFWQIGEGLGRKRSVQARTEELARARKVVTAMHQLPPDSSRITTGIVDGDIPLYSRAPGNLDTIGIQPLLWACSQEFTESLDFLKRRRHLAARSNLSGLFWAWIPAATPTIVRANVWGDDVPPAWGLPRVSPEQLRVMTFMALAAGYRGLGYMGDADLTRPAGRMLLIEMAILNEEIDLCESILARSSDPIPVYHVFDPPPPDLPPPGSAMGTKVRPQKELHQARPDGFSNRGRAQGCPSVAGRLCRQCPVSTSPDGRAEPGYPGEHAGKRASLRDQSRRDQDAAPRTYRLGHRDCSGRVQHHVHDPVHNRPGTERPSGGCHRPGSASGSATGHRTGRADAPVSHRDQWAAQRRRPAPVHRGRLEEANRGRDHDPADG